MSHVCDSELEGRRIRQIRGLEQVTEQEPGVLGFTLNGASETERNGCGTRGILFT